MCCDLPVTCLALRLVHVVYDKLIRSCHLTATYYWPFSESNGNGLINDHCGYRDLGLHAE
jgi:hypothetical protein